MLIRSLVVEPGVTKGKIYEVIHIDDDGDSWFLDDNGSQYFLCSYEYEVVDPCDRNLITKDKRQDIRILSLDEDGEGFHHVVQVVYNDDDTVLAVLDPPVSVHESYAEALQFVDNMYRASLKPVLFR